VSHGFYLVQRDLQRYFFLRVLSCHLRNEVWGGGGVVEATYSTVRVFQIVSLCQCIGYSEEANYIFSLQSMWYGLCAPFCDRTAVRTTNSVHKTICCNSISNAPDVTETCRAKNTSIKLHSCIKLTFQIISWGRCTLKQPSFFLTVHCKHEVSFPMLSRQFNIQLGSWYLRYSYVSN